VSHYDVGVPVGDDVPVEVGDPVSVGDDELLADEDGLVGGEPLGDLVGFADLVGFGLPAGVGAVAEGCTSRLGVGVSELGGAWLVWSVCVVAGELRCWAVLVSTFPLFRLEMCPVRYSPAVAAAAHRAAVDPATTSWRRRLARCGALMPRGPVPVPAAPGSAPVTAAGRSARVAPG
jgi:hypothetical protein